MNTLIMWVMACGAVLGGLDRILGNRFGLGKRFEEGFELLGATALSMAGIICLVPLYIDKSSRLCATMKVYHYLKKESPYEKGDHVTGRIYEISNNFGAFVAVDDCYSGLIPKREAAEHYQVGEVLSLRVTAVKADGKLDLSSRERIPEQMNRDAEEVLRRLEEKGGVFDFTDKADPELIKEELGLTKNAFKRAVGRLLKQEKIEMSNGKIVKK